jgi:hypothetical protein
LLISFSEKNVHELILKLKVIFVLSVDRESSDCAGIWSISPIGEIIMASSSQLID